MFTRVTDDIILDFLEQLCREYKFIESLVTGAEDFVFVTHLVTVTLIDEHNVFTNTKDGVHIVSIYDCSHTILMCNVTQ